MYGLPPLYQKFFISTQKVKRGKSNSQIRGIKPLTLPDVLNSSIPLKLVSGFMMGVLVYSYFDSIAN